MSCVGPLWALAAVAAAWTAAATGVVQAGEGQAVLPPSAVQPRHPPDVKSQLAGASKANAGDETRHLESSNEDCESKAGGWSSGSFVGGIAIGISLTLLCTVLPVAYAHRCAANSEQEADESGAEKGKAQEGASGEVNADRSLERREAEPGVRRMTEPVRELHRPEAQGIKGCTDEVETMHLFWPRAFFLVAMLLVQSISSLILSGFEGLIEHHTELIFFLTMIVGLGGNAGGQSMVLAVRGLATGKQVYVYEQLVRGILLSVVLVPIAFLRVLVQHGSLGVSFTVAISCLAVLATSTSCGTALPRILLTLGVDPAHGATMIQVLMDIGGIAIVCAVAVMVLGG